MGGPVWLNYSSPWPIDNECKPNDHWETTSLTERFAVCQTPRSRVPIRDKRPAVSCRHMRMLSAITWHVALRERRNTFASIANKPVSLMQFTKPRWLRCGPGPGFLSNAGFRVKLFFA